MVLDDLRQPVVLAPMAGGPATPALAVAASEAGGLGFLAAGYLSVDVLAAQIAAVRAGTRAPFGVNLFVPGGAQPDPDALLAYVERLRAEAARQGVEPGEPRDDDDGWDEKLRILVDASVPVVSFTFGCPPADVVRSLRRAGSEVWITVTETAEARAAAEAGADVLVAQGVEAGGHQATWQDRDDAPGLGLLALLRLVCAETSLPVVATGGIADAPAVAAALAAGAAAAQCGTAFLLAPEAGTNPAHRAALGGDTPTALTRAFTGRRARGLVNRFLLDNSAGAPIAYPHVHHATAPLRAAARQRGDAGGFNLWAGQAHRLARAAPAAEIVGALAERA